MSYFSYPVDYKAVIEGTFDHTCSTFTRILYDKEYELKDHFGNVRLVFSDLKLRTVDTTFDLDLRNVINSLYKDK